MSSGSGKVYIVGAGPGDPGLLTLRAAHALRTAEVLLYDALASDPTVAMAPPSCRKIFVGKRGGNHAMTQDEIEATILREAGNGRRVVRLKGGDPFVFGRGGEEAQALAQAGIPFEIVPGISSSIAAPAYAGIPVTHRDFNTAFTVATGHEDPTKPESTVDWAKLADPHRTLVMLMAMGNLDAIAQRLIEHGMDPATPCAVIQEGTRPSQRTVTGTLASIAVDVARAALQAPAIVVIGGVVTLREHIRWFDNAPLFGKRVLITRPAQDADDFAAALYARGAEPVFASTIVIGPPDDPLDAHRAVDRLANYAWVVFNSHNGVDAFFERLRSLDADARYLGHARVAAIGSKTAERLAHYGVRADLVPAAFVGEELGRALIEATGRDAAILIYQAQDGRDILARLLEQAGRKPTVVAAYKTSFARDDAFAAKVASADVVTFTSASTVSGYARMLGGREAACAASRGKIVACIGPVTAEAAREAGFEPDVVAGVFTTDGLLDALEAHLTQRS